MSVCHRVHWAPHPVARLGQRWGLLAGVSLGLGVALAAQAQSTTAVASDAARQALGKQDGDVDQAALLKETLTASDKQYALLKQGKWSATFDFSYAYTGQQQIDAKFTDSTLTLFKITNTRAHTFTNTLALERGLRDNLTGSLSLPLVSKYAESSSFSGTSHSWGDLQAGLRWQPFESKRNTASFTTSAGLRLPTGRSPFKVMDGQNLATGSGTAGLTLGANTSRIIDPIALFGSLNVGLSMPARHLSQVRDGVVLKEVHPGPSVGFGVGFAYALSYDVSTTMSLQESVSLPTTLVLGDGTRNRTSVQASAMFNIGLGVRTSPQTTYNLTLGIGLTSDSPDFTLGVNLPLNF